jgi:hypothetical protein
MVFLHPSCIAAKPEEAAQTFDVLLCRKGAVIPTCLELPERVHVELLEKVESPDPRTNAGAWFLGGV